MCQPEQYQTSKETVGAIAARLQSVHRPFAGAQIRVAMFRDATGPRFLTGTAVFAETILDSRPNADYQRLQLLETWIDGQDAARDFISRLLLGQESINGYKIPNTFTHTVVRHDPSGDSVSKWPSWVYTISTDSQNRNQRLHLDQQPTVNIGLEPFCSPADAVRRWIFNSDRSNHPLSDIPNQEHLLVVVPDTRARFSRGQWSPGRLNLELEINTPLVDVELQLIHMGSTKRYAIHAVQNEPMMLDIPEDSQQLILYIVHKNGDLICNKTLHAGYRSFGVPDEETQQHDFASDLQKGENEEREFKPFVGLDDKKKKSELTKTVVAFANTSGGRLFVGLDDEGAPLGRPEAQKLFRGSADPIEAQLTSIKSLFRENIKPVPDIAYKVVEVNGNPVIVVDVNKLAGGCSTQENHTFIRKGATNRHADLQTEIPSILEVPNSFGLAQGGQY